MAEQALIHRDARAGVVHLAAVGLATQLPGELADLGDGLGGDGLTEAGEAATGVHRHPSAQCRRATAQQSLRFACLAQSDVLVPVQFQCGGQVVDLREGQVGGTDAGLLVGRTPDRLLEGLD